MNLLGLRVVGRRLERPTGRVVPHSPTAATRRRDPARVPRHQPPTSALTDPRSAGLFERALTRADQIDWRYKVQATAIFCLLCLGGMFAARQWLLGLGDWGYAGAFLVGLEGNATVILPAPGGALVAVLGSEFNPFVVGIAAGIGGAFGGATAYLVGAVNRGEGSGGWSRRLQRLMGRFGGGVVLASATVPVLPGDVGGIVAGATRYPLRRYLVYSGLGNVTKATGIAHLAGQLGADVTVTLEIEATLPSGASDQIVRTVTENSRTLKFTSQGFEKE